MSATGGADVVGRRIDACYRCVLAVLLTVIGSVVVISAGDHVLLAKRGYEASAYNGSTIRSLRESTRAGPSKADSWRPMNEALRILKSPGGDRLYEQVFLEDQVKFQYPPTSLVYLSVLDAVGLGSPEALDVINIVIVVAGCFGCAYLVLSLLRPRLPWGLETWQLGVLVILLTLAALLSYPFVRALELGQIQAWINTLFIFACIAWIRGAKATAGALLATAATIKPQLGIFLIWALLWREWPFLRGFLLAGVPIGLVSLLLFGVHNHVAYLDVLSYISRHGEAYFANQSVNGLVHRALGNGVNLEFQPYEFPPADPYVVAATSLAGVAFLAIALLPALRAGERRPDIVDVAIAALCVTMASPIAWDHHYGLLPPLFGIALALLCASDGHRTALLWLVASWVVASNFLPFTNYLADTWLNFLQSYLFFAALILLGVLIDLRRRNPDGVDMQPA
jgi:hypothetical protein